MELSGLAAVSAPLPWQDSAWDRLLQQLAGDKLPHALLLAGPRGTGKSQLALALARLLLCAAPVDGLNCGSCHPCNLSAAGNHGDLRWLQPEEKSRVIKIDQVRSLVEFASKTASFGARKAVVLAPADALNRNAANALLKCLEEPAAGTHLILVCHRLHGVPATVRSRCQLLRFPLPPQEDCLRWLDQWTEQRPLSEQLLQATDGSPLQAQALHDSGAVANLEAVRKGLDALRLGKLAAPEMAALLGETPMEELLTQLRSYIQRWLQGGGRALLVQPGSRQAFALLDELQRLQGAMDAGANPNRQLLLDTLLSRFQQDLGGVSISAEHREAHT